MKDELITISYVEDGQTHVWLRVGTYDDEKHPNRKYCYQEGIRVVWFNDAQSVNDVLAYIFRNVVNMEAITEKGITLIIEKAKDR